MKRILIIEDDISLNNGIRLALNREFECAQAFTLKEADEAYRSQQFDLLILDVNLSDGSGLDFLTEIRRKDQIPVIILTANKMEMDIVTGLELGANDYITKPFSLMVLRARVNVQLRSTKAQEDVFSNGDYHFDFEKMEFLSGKDRLELSKTEQRLLRCLVENKGKTLTKSILIDYIWQGESEYVEEHALTVVINRLRNKLGVNQTYIKTVYGIGYTWEQG